LPNKWVRSNLKEISLRITKGSTPTSYGFTYKNAGINFVKAENINEKGEIKNISDFIDEETNTFLKRSILQAGDLLFSIAGTIGRVGIVQEKNLPANTNQALAIIRPFSHIYNKYAFYYLNSGLIQKQALSTIVGVGRANLSLTNVSEFPFPLPPLPEQHRIVEKIEELFTNLDAGVENLIKIKTQLKRYRQAVLKYAFEGKLTEEWREANRDRLEPASILLKQILIENKKQPIDLNKLNLSTLPNEWVQTKLWQVTNIVEKVNPKENPNEEFAYVDISSIDNRTAKITKPKKYIGENAPTRARQLIKSGDILFSTVRTYLKNTANVSDKYNNQIASTGFCVIRPHNLINNRMIFYLVQSDSFINPLNYIQRGTSYPAVRDSDVFESIIPLSPLLEQQKIVEEIERHFSIADQIEKTVEQGMLQSERLRQSILKNAFEGKLVPQDPNDEPAEKLLERIKAERAKRE